MDLTAVATGVLLRVARMWIEEMRWRERRGRREDGRRSKVSRVRVR